MSDVISCAAARSNANSSDETSDLYNILEISKDTYG
jgi:hypothetical protein